MVLTTASKDSFVMRGPLNLEDLIFVGLETVQFHFQIPHVPQSNRLVSWTRGQDILVVGVKRQTIHLDQVNNQSEPVI